MKRGGWCSVGGRAGALRPGLYLQVSGFALAEKRRHYGFIGAERETLLETQQPPGP